MSFPDLKYSLEIWPEGAVSRYVLECVHTPATNGWDFGRLFIEVAARGRRPSWKEVPKDGPRYSQVTNTRGTIARFEDMRPDPEQPDA